MDQALDVILTVGEGLGDGKAAYAFVQMQRAQDYYRKALSSLPECDRYNQVSSLVMAAIYQTLLSEISKDNFQVMEHRIKLTPVRKLWIAWKTYRYEKKIHKK